MARSQRQPLDQDRNVIISVSSVDGITPFPLEINPATGRLLVDATGGGSGGALNTQAKGVTAAGYPTSTTASTDRQPLDVTLRDTAGNPVAVGGGTQYAEGVTTAPATGTAVLGRYSLTAPTLTNGQLNVPQLDASGNIKVNVVASSGSTTIVTQPTGTNLHTVTDSGSVTAATLNAETTKAIGVVRTSDGAGNLLTSTASALDVNIKSGASSGTQYAEGTTTAPATGTVALGRYKLTSPTLTDGQMNSPLLDVNGNLKVNIAAGASSGAVAQSSTTSGQTGGLTQAATTTSAPAYTTGTTNPLSTTLTGALRTDASATTQPVSLAVAPTTPVTGTFFQATQPVSIATAPTTPVTGTFFQATQPVSLATNTPTLQTGSTTAVTQATGTNLHTVTDTGSTTAVTSLPSIPTGTNAIGSITNTTFAATQATAANLNATVVGNGTFATQVTALPALATGANAIGSITNTSFISTQATAANLNATIVGTGTLATQVTSLPALATGANAIGSITNTSFIATQATGTNLHTVVDSGTISAVTAITNALPTGTNSIGSVKIPDLATAGALAALNATVTTAVNSQGIVAIQLTGTWVGTITFQGTEDPLGVTAPTTSFFNVNGVASVTGAQVTSTTANGQFRVNAGGYTAVRTIMTVFTSGSATVWLNASLAPSMATLAEPLPVGINAIGTVGTTSAVINVGQKVVATTATQISATSTIPTNGIIIQALSTNTASLFVGGSTVTTTTGFELTAGQSMSFTANLNTLYIISVASTTDKICWNVE